MNFGCTSFGCAGSGCANGMKSNCLRECLPALRAFPGDMDVRAGLEHEALSAAYQGDAARLAGMIGHGRLAEVTESARAYSDI